MKNNNINNNIKVKSAVISNDSKIKIHKCMCCSTKDNIKPLYNLADVYICDECREVTEFMCDMLCG